MGASVLGLSLIIGAFTWLVPARLVRGEVLTLRTRDFVSAARTVGSSRWRLINRHMIPHALGGPSHLRDPSVSAPPARMPPTSPVGQELAKVPAWDERPASASAPSP